VFWLALYGTRGQLAIGIAGLGAVFFVPLVLLGAPEYPSTEWRTAILWICVAPIVGYSVQALVAELRSRAKETRLALANIEAITVAMREIGASTDPDAVRQAVCVSARSIAGADVVQLLEPSADGRLALSAAAGMRIPRAGEEAGGGLAYLTRKPVFLGEATHGARHGVRSMHFEPILRDESAVAVLVLGWSKPVKRLSQGVESGMQMLTAEAAIALDRARLLVQLQETARTDDLTGLPNRRAWDEELPRELARAARDARPVCVAMLDLDRFKRFNDHRGHQAGDRLLKQAASAWASLLRASDMLARYGGEEFSLLLPGCTVDDAQRLVGRLRAAMPDGETVSAGIACWDETETADEFVGRADEALYAAKRSGRNPPASPCTGAPGGGLATSPMLGGGGRGYARPASVRLGGLSTANGSVTSSLGVRNRNSAGGRPPVRPGSRRPPVGSRTPRRTRTLWRFVAETSWPSAAA
jgi:diguanylate cyclase (GGDEF)-like protein